MNSKLKLINFASRILLRIGGNSITQSKISQKVANYLLKNYLDENGIFEIQGFKIKKGRTTRFLILTGMHEPSTTALIKKEVDHNMVVFDIGANIGWFSLISSKLVGNGGHVYAFEPDPYLFKTLRENIALNQIKNISPFQLAISNTTGKGKFCLNSTQDGDNRLESVSKNENSIEIDTITLDEFCKRYNVLPDFIKMDIQGSEPKAFEGMKKILSQNSQLKIITEFYPEAIIDVGSSPVKFLRFLRESGFVIKEVVENSIGTLNDIQDEKLLRMKDATNLYCFKQY